jgi:DNA-binding MltR family transcriptional regulator
VKKTAKAPPRAGILNLLTGESDRGCALVAGEAFNDLLSSLLGRLFIESKTSRDLLNGGGSAPLGTFSARIHACFALGLICEDEQADLHAIRRIRNSAAHFREANVFSFALEKTIEACRTLRAKSPASMKMIEAEMGVRGHFIGRVVGLYVALQSRQESIHRVTSPRNGRTSK